MLTEHPRSGRACGLLLAALAAGCTSTRGPVPAPETPAPAEPVMGARHHALRARPRDTLTHDGDAERVFARQRQRNRKGP